MANAVALTDRLWAGVRASSWHLLISACIAALAALVVMGLWYPYPYRDLAGGLRLFWIMVAVDVVCGPLLTLVMFNPAKSRRELTLDLSLVAIVQLAALGYGLYSISLARPVMLVHETDRFVAVSVAAVQQEKLGEALPQYQRLSWTGPVLAGVRQPRDGQETLHSIELSLQGVEPSLRPDWWQPYVDSIEEVKQRMKPVSALQAKLTPQAQEALNQAVKKIAIPAEQLHYLPLVSRNNLDGWVVLLNAQAEIVGYAPVPGFE